MSCTSHKWAILFGIMLFYVALYPSSVLATQTEANTAISSTENYLVTCYGATLDAEANGANVTSLVTVLNDADDLLNQAKLVYASNDFDTAQELAVQSEGLLSSLISDANALKEMAIQNAPQDFLFNVILPIFVSILILVAGLAAWVRLNRRQSQFGEQ